ncbi:MAG: hypothetical protein HY716_12410 [Planctomycetes bacterium]|nr:hypothetical protein [Planctomycetota bacterium]
MRKLIMLSLAMSLFLPAAFAQDDDKQKRKEEEKQKKEEAEKVIKEYRAARAKAKNGGEVVLAIEDHLEKAEPHPLIRAQLILLLGDQSIDVRVACMNALGKYKKDVEAGKALLLHARRNREELELRQKCLLKFGMIASYGMSDMLKEWIRHESVELAKEAIDAVREINSVRMIKPLIELLGELESIREDKNSGAGGPQGQGQQGQQGQYQGPGSQYGAGQTPRKDPAERKRELTKPVVDTINALWKKYDDKIKIEKYRDANKAYMKSAPFFRKIIEQEDKEDKGIMEGDDKKD